MLFGHHFAAIAGAGPLLGPVLAAQFGFLPGFLWIVIGAVLAGAVQDFVILVGSLRRNGRSLPEIARAEIGWITGTATAVAVLFIVIVALAGLGLAVVNALVANPWGTFTIAMTIPIALLMGWYHHHVRPGRVGEMSLIGIILLVLSVALGKMVAQSDLATWFAHDRTTLVWLLAGYGFLASVLPMWMLLVPRDYLSTFMKLGVIGLLAIGVIILAPDLHMPAVTGFIAGGGPIIPGPLFPFLFITIACGAISGFHSLVSSGTTPKMIARESQAMVGYGAMLLESFVGVVALISASLLIPGDYFAINTRLPADALGSHGIPRRKHSHALATGRSGRLGPARRRGVAGRGNGLDFFCPAGDGRAHGLLVSIRAAVRGPVYPDDHRRGHARGTLPRSGNGRARVCSASPNQLVARRHPVSSALVVGAWGWLIATGTISTVWPMFGAANQLLGTLALCIGTTLFIKMDKARYLWVTAVPMVFVGTITLTGCHDLWWIFLDRARHRRGPGGARHDDAQRGIGRDWSPVLALVVLTESAMKWYQYLVLKQPYTTTEIIDGEGIRIPEGKCC